MQADVLSPESDVLRTSDPHHEVPGGLAGPLHIPTTAAREEE